MMTTNAMKKQYQEAYSAQRKAAALRESLNALDYCNYMDDSANMIVRQLIRDEIRRLESLPDYHHGAYFSFWDRDKVCKYETGKWAYSYLQPSSYQIPGRTLKEFYRFTWEELMLGYQAEKQIEARAEKVG